MSVLDPFPNYHGLGALAQLAEEVAARVVADLHCERQVLNVFSALHRLPRRSLNHVATAWNRKHDRSRVLPPEIQELCFSPLPMAQKCQLSLVCSHWQRNTTSLPRLWTEMVIHRKTAHLHSLFARSGQLPFNVSFSEPLTPPFEDLDLDMRGTWHRLRRLTISLHDTQSHGALFRHPVPQLEELRLSRSCHKAFLAVIPTIFSQCAPRLRNIYLSLVDLPPRCPAFASATSLTLDRCRGSLTRLLVAMPLVKNLNIVSLIYSAHLHWIPALAPVVNLDGQPESDLTAEGLALDTFLRLVSALDSLTITEKVGAEIAQYAAQHFTTPASTLRFCTDQTLEFITEASGCRMRFSAPSITLTSQLHNLTREVHAFDAVERFELPASFDRQQRFSDRPLMDGGDSVSLPSLRTLVIRSNGAYDDFFMLRPGVFGGKLCAPVLKTIIITKSPDAPPAAVDADHLVRFILDVLDVGDRGSLELSVDSALGLGIEGDVDELRSFIGNIVV